MTIAPIGQSQPGNASQSQSEERYTACKKRCSACTNLLESTGQLARRIFVCKTLPKKPTRDEIIAARQQASPLHEALGEGVGEVAKVAMMLNKNFFDAAGNAAAGAVELVVNLAMPAAIGVLPIPKGAIARGAGNFVRSQSDKSQDKSGGIIKTLEIEVKASGFKSIDFSKTALEKSRSLFQRKDAEHKD